MAKDLNMSRLTDFYGRLLTDKELEAVDMYYNSDMSLSEIAEENRISRQAVRNSIKAAEAKMLELEDKLGLVSRFTDVMKDIDCMKRIISEMEETPRTVRLAELADGILDKI